ncbi:hypothetical protein GRI40_04940 [Altererythrobacter aerius]|uniref:DUF995 domain-containing protein n=1 Tax=Tsuneonella aeria TaxID=1837929 RepID=A0A6I4TDW4_9SPHN|nr:hypothetical protein [Tsuneonella aeria]MXO74568.1 hypothetical protein [Tsuneonella aeria]
MKNIALLAGLAMLGACAQEAPTASEPADAVAAATPSPAAAAAVMAADGQPPVGRYRITAGDGQVFNEELRADGTYVQTDQAGATVETGRWNQKSPTEFCFTADKPDATEVCNTEKVENGVWTSTDPEGRTAKVERVTA